MKKLILAVPTIVAIGLGINGCGMTNHNNDSQGVLFPNFKDDNSNRVNDYLESSSHLTLSDKTSDHDFVDRNNDGICDQAQDASNSWHGPGYVDSNENGVCDYWDDSTNHHNMEMVMKFIDTNANQINDPFEKETHQANGHDFLDQNEDGICDIGQTGQASSWHGKNHLDTDGNMIMDHWQNGGMGHR